jgi:hypothetical protein
MASRFSVDAIAAPLARGERPVVWGLNVNVFPMELDDLREPYNAWVAAAEVAMAGTGAYFYPFDHVHVTAASPAPFTHAPLSGWTGEERATYTAGVQGALTAATASPDWPVAPFPLVAGVQWALHASCGIMLLEDPTGAVPRLRAALRAATHESWVEGSPLAALHARSGDKAPNIVHSSVMRFAAPREAGMSDEEVEARWAAAVAAWPAPLTFLAREATLIEENVAFQHVRQADVLLARYPYADNRLAAQAAAAMGS